MAFMTIAFRLAWNHSEDDALIRITEDISKEAYSAIKLNRREIYCKMISLICDVAGWLGFLVKNKKGKISYGGVYGARIDNSNFHH